MEQLEINVLEFFKSTIKLDVIHREYIQIDGELISLLFVNSCKDTLDIFLESTAPIENISVETFKISKIINNLYKVIWSDSFLYLIGELELEDSSVIQERILLSKKTSTPLSTYVDELKTLI